MTFENRKPHNGDLIFRVWRKGHTTDKARERQPVYYRRKGKTPGTIIVASITRPDEQIEGQRIEDFEWIDGTPLQLPQGEHK